jgi:phosphatidylethanolamine/phosphatidyl-N-methylethanolamine N-methyltransferase
VDRALSYRLAAPFYDLAMAGVLRGARRDSIASLELKPGDRLLIPGIGTGLDLPLLPPWLEVLGGDFSPGMLARAEARRRESGLTRVRLATLDAMALPVPAASFDAALLHLILAVAPDGARVLAEACRAVKPGGRIAVLDKFLPAEAEGVPLWRWGFQALMLPFTDVNRRFEELARGLPLKVLSDEGVLLGRTFRRVLLERT